MENDDMTWIVNFETEFTGYFDVSETLYITGINSLSSMVRYFYFIACRNLHFNLNY